MMMRRGSKRSSLCASSLEGAVRLGGTAARSAARLRIRQSLTYICPISFPACHAPAASLDSSPAYQRNFFLRCLLQCVPPSPPLPPPHQQMQMERQGSPPEATRQQGRGDSNPERKKRSLAILPTVEEAWHEEWRQRLTCWWIGLPTPTQVHHEQASPSSQPPAPNPLPTTLQPPSNLPQPTPTTPNRPQPSPTCPNLPPTCSRRRDAGAARELRGRALAPPRCEARGAHWEDSAGGSRHGAGSSRGGESNEGRRGGSGRLWAHGGEGAGMRVASRRLLRAISPPRLADAHGPRVLAPANPKAAPFPRAAPPAQPGAAAGRRGRRGRRGRGGGGF